MRVLGQFAITPSFISFMYDHTIHYLLDLRELEAHELKSAQAPLHMPCWFTMRCLPLRAMSLQTRVV